MDFFKGLGALLVSLLVIGGLWMALVLANGIQTEKYECVVKVSRSSGEVTSDRLYIGLDEHKWWARIFRWDKAFDVIAESDSSNDFFWGNYAGEQNVRFFRSANSAFAVSGYLSLLSGRLDLQLGGAKTYAGTCKKIS